MRLFRPFGLFRKFFPEAIFRIKTAQKIMCLTFDDGPNPGSTPHLVNILEKYGIKAVFFCTGRQAEKYPSLMDQIRRGGHVTGNHGYDHLNGWMSTTKNYLVNAGRAANLTSDDLFRPPFGRITPWQYQNLKKKYKICLWDLMPYDFDQSFGSRKSLEVLKTGIRPGSVIVLHDTPSSCASLILEEFIEYSLKAGYTFEPPSLLYQ